jgi:hypothetical protein
LDRKYVKDAAGTDIDWPLLDGAAYNNELAYLQPLGPE